MCFSFKFGENNPINVIYINKPIPISTIINDLILSNK